MRLAIIESIRDAFSYERKNNFIYVLDPRTKMLYVACIMVSIFLVSDWIRLILILLVQLPLAIMGKYSRKVLNLLRGLSLFIIFLICFNIIVTYIFEGFKLELSSLMNTIPAMITRVIIALMTLSFLISTTSPWELLQGLSKLHINYTYLYPFIIAYRFIPIMFNEMKSIYDAQRSRGLELEKGNIIQKAKKLIPIIIPTIVCALLRARDLAEAMEARGFGYSKRRTFYKPVRFKLMDLAFIIVYIVFLIIVIGFWDKIMYLSNVG